MGVFLNPTSCVFGSCWRTWVTCCHLIYFVVIEVEFTVGAVNSWGHVVHIIGAMGGEQTPIANDVHTN